MSCWNLWGSRNRMVHEGAVFDAPQLFKFTQQNLDKYAEAQIFFASPRPPDQEIVWTPPPAGTIKINFDGAIHSTTGSAGLGIIARDSTGTIIAWHRIHVPFQTNPTITEALAALAAIRLAFQFLFSIIQVEGDCLQVIRELQSSDLYVTSFLCHCKISMACFKLIFLLLLACLLQSSLNPFQFLVHDRNIPEFSDVIQ